MPGRKKAALAYWSVGCLLSGVLVAPVFYAEKPEDHSTHYNHEHEASHRLIEVDPARVPDVSVRAVRDQRSGWNLIVETNNFAFTPENTNGQNVMNEGHAHLFVNGEKLGRLYGHHYHLSDLPPGEYEIAVSLTSNDHGLFAIDGEPIEAVTTITQAP